MQSNGTLSPDDQVFSGNKALTPDFLLFPFFLSTCMSCLFWAFAQACPHCYPSPPPLGRETAPPLLASTLLTRKLPSPSDLLPSFVQNCSLARLPPPGPAPSISVGQAVPGLPVSLSQTRSASLCGLPGRSRGAAPLHPQQTWDRPGLGPRGQLCSPGPLPSLASSELSTWTRRARRKKHSFIPCGKDCSRAASTLPGKAGSVLGPQRGQGSGRVTADPTGRLGWRRLPLPQSFSR